MQSTTTDPTIADWTTATLDFLQEYNGAFLAIFTLALVLATVTLVIVTMRLAVETYRVRKAGTEPELVAYLIPIERYPTLVNFVIANIGQGPAKHVRVALEADRDDFAKHKVTIDKAKILEGLNVLPQGEKLAMFFGEGPVLVEEPQLKPFNARLSFEGRDGKRRETTFKIDVGQFDGMGTIGRPAEHEMAEALKEIAGHIQHWTNGFRRLKVETTTLAEEEQRKRELLEDARKMKDKDKNERETRPAD